GLREIVDQVLKSSLGDLRLFQLDECERFLVECRRRLLTARVVRDDLPKFLNRLPELFLSALGLRAIGIAARQAEVRLAKPVLRVAGELVIGEAPDEIPEIADGELIGPLTEIDVGGLVDIVGLERSGRRSRRRRGHRRAGRHCRSLRWCSTRSRADGARSWRA